LVSWHRPTNTTAKSGIGTLAAVLPPARLANNQPIASTTGNIRKTRNNLTITAVLPAVSDTAYPDPTTCATSWIVAPSMTPAVCASNPNQLQMSGEKTMATVESAFTATTTKATSISLPL